MGGEGQERFIGRTAWEKANIIVLLYVQWKHMHNNFKHGHKRICIYMWRKTSVHAVMNTLPCLRKQAKMSTSCMKGGWPGQNGDQKLLFQQTVCSL